MKIELNVDYDDACKRTDMFLVEHIDFSRSQIKKLFDEKKVFVNGKSVKAGYILQYQDIVTANYEKPSPLSAEPENLPLNIVYEDDDLAVINKPQGMVTHPATSNKTGTLVNALVFHINSLSNINGEYRPGIVHRLDKDTSGLLIIAKNDKAHANLAKQIELKYCKRQYLAIISGHFKEDSGQILTGIKRSDKDRKKMMVCPQDQGKLAITNYKTIEHFNGYSLVEFSLLTGRTHQIRVHSASLNHPIVGDNIYGGNTKIYSKGQLLCAYKIKFKHPTTNEDLFFQIPLPNYFDKVLEYLRSNSLQN